jgi:hypothetical protein
MRFRPDQLNSTVFKNAGQKPAQIDRLRSVFQERNETFSPASLLFLNLFLTNRKQIPVTIRT